MRDSEVKISAGRAITNTKRLSTSLAESGNSFKRAVR